MSLTGFYRAQAPSEEPETAAHSGQASSFCKTALHSSEMLTDSYGTLDKLSGGWIKGDPAWATHFWCKGSLIKYVPAVEGEGGSNVKTQLLVAVCRDRALLGVVVIPVGPAFDIRATRKLADKRQVIMVVNSESELPSWALNKRYTDITLVYDRSELKGLYVAKLSCK